jgi:membrane-associated protease RseP (regulator of RpoE activity)
VASVDQLVHPTLAYPASLAGDVASALGSIVLFALMVIALMILHELGHYAVAALSGLPVSRIVVGSPKGKLLARIHIGRQPVEIYRRVPVMMALDVDDAALIQAGFWRRCLFGAAGPATNFLLVLLAAVGSVGLARGAALAGDFISANLRAFGVFFLAPFGVGSSADFFTGFLPTASGAGTLAVWWMELNALIGVANIFPLPALDGGVIMVSLLMTVARDRERAKRVFDRWYAWAPRVAAWLPWVFILLTVYHVVRLVV